MNSVTLTGKQKINNAEFSLLPAWRKKSNSVFFLLILPENYYKTSRKGNASVVASFCHSIAFLSN
jgi:hypothetical protein